MLPETPSTPDTPKTKKEKSSELAISTVKEILVLSTGAIGLSLTFLEKLLGYENLWMLIVGWSSLLVSIFFGILFLLNIIGMVHIDGEGDIYEKKPRLFFTFHLLAFFIGVLFISSFLVIRTFEVKPKTENSFLKIESLNKSFRIDKNHDSLQIFSLKDSIRIIINSK
jgi:hypothetical protein